jgi:uncharacterized protein YigA (DUF484 family)
MSDGNYQAWWEEMEKKAKPCMVCGHDDEESCGHTMADVRPALSAYRARIQTLEEKLATRYWEGIATENGKLRARIKALEKTLTDARIQLESLVGEGHPFLRRLGNVLAGEGE